MPLTLQDKINPAHTALIVIDIQKDFAAPDGLLGKMGRDLSMVPPMLEKLTALIDTAKQRHILTLYAKQVYDRTKMTPLQLESYDQGEQLITCDIAGDGHEFYAINPPQKDVFIKYNFNVFSNPEFMATLTKHGIKTLVITGMDSIYCVETAIRNAFDLGFQVVVPQDLIACNAKNIDLHNCTLTLTKKVFGTVVTANDVSRIWLESS